MYADRIRGRLKGGGKERERKILLRESLERDDFLNTKTSIIALPRGSRLPSFYSLHHAVPTKRVTTTVELNETARSSDLQRIYEKVSKLKPVSFVDYRRSSSPRNERIIQCRSTRRSFSVDRCKMHRNGTGGHIKASSKTELEFKV